jgi:hypothetical protein
VSSRIPRVDTAPLRQDCRCVPAICGQCWLALVCRGQRCCDHGPRSVASGNARSLLSCDQRGGGGGQLSPDTAHEHSLAAYASQPTWCDSRRRTLPHSSNPLTGVSSPLAWVESQARVKELEADKQRIALELVELKELRQAETFDRQREGAAHRAETSTSASDLELVHHEAALSAERAARLERELARAKSHAAEAEQEAARLADSLAEAKARAVHTPSSSGSGGAGADMDAATARRLRKLEFENSKLQQRIENAALLARKLELAEGKLERAEARAARTAQLELELTDYHRLKAQWEQLRTGAAAASGGGGSSEGVDDGDEVDRLSSPEAVVRLVSDLRMQRTLATSRNNELQTELKLAGEARKRLEAQMAQMKVDMAALRTRAERCACCVCCGQGTCFFVECEWVRVHGCVWALVHFGCGQGQFAEKFPRYVKI